MPHPVALITGIGGQDGYYLTRQLLESGYKVHGLVRGTPARTLRISPLLKEYEPSLVLHFGDILDLACLTRVLSQIEVDEVYHLGAQSHVGISFEQPLYTCDVNGLGTVRLLQAITMLKLNHRIRFYNACSSEVFGRTLEVPQSEATPFHPVSPYGASKALAYWVTKMMREHHNMYAVSGILFNHESPSRGETFVTRKITLGVARIARGVADDISLGYLDAKRDWTHAEDMVRGIHLMMKQETPDDFVLASGTSRSVRQFAEMAFKVIGVDLKWRGKGEREVGYDARDGTVRVRVDKQFFRPLEVEALLGDPKKASEKLQWYPRISFEDLVREMVEADLDALASSKPLKCYM